MGRERTKRRRNEGKGRKEKQKTDLHRRTYCWSQHPNTEPGIKTRCWIAAVAARSAREGPGALQRRLRRRLRRRHLPFPQLSCIPAPCRSPARVQD